MTRNQIDFASQREQARANQASEKETHLHNLLSRVEQKRANLAREKETAQHNRAEESENIRRNSLQSQYNYANLGEQHRANVAAENAKMRDQALNRQDVRTRQRQAAVSEGNLAISNYLAPGQRSLNLENANLAKVKQLTESINAGSNFIKAMSSVGRNASQNATDAQKRKEYNSNVKTNQTTEAAARSIRKALSGQAR